MKESLQVLAVRATTESDRKFQLTIDKETKRSYIDLVELAKRGGLSFKSHYWTDGIRKRNREISDLGRRK